MKLYVVRHGLTDVNLQYRINSLNDDDLNAEGVEQALELKNKFENIDYDIIISSPLKRTIHTAELLNSRNKSIVLDERIQERDAGVLTKASLNNIDNNDWWNIHPKCDYYDAETVLNVIERVKQFLDEIKVKHKNKNIVIVTHGGVSKAIKCYFCGIPDDGNIGIYKHNNCEIMEYEL